MWLRLTGKLWFQQGLSWLAGLYHDTRYSRRKISSFVKKLDIDLNECEKFVEDYTSFNEFFARELKPEARPISAEPNALISPGDGRLLVFPRLNDDSLAYVKWAPVHLMDLFQRDKSLVERFRGGSCAVLRLCPADYHRFHFPVSGVAGATLTVPGLLHSVNPYALEQRIPVFAMNKRTMCSIESSDFGTVLMMEVGALCVGSICQTYPENSRVRRGDEKGYFKFGGSTTLLFLESGTANFDDDLVRNSQRGIETIVKMGETIASSTTERRLEQ